MNLSKRDISLKSCVRLPGWTKGMGQRPKFSFFSEYGHVAYHIKVDEKRCCMVSSILTIDPLTLGWIKRSKLHFFRTCLCCIST